LSEIRSFIKPTKHLSMRKQCELLEICRSSLFYKPKGESEENLLIMRKIDEHHLDQPTYGVLQMEDYLRSEGYQINEKRVRRLMRKMAIYPIYPGPNLSKLGKAEYIRPYLLRHLNIERVNQVWEIDITYIPMQKGFLYLTAIIDVYSRFVVGWELSNSLEAETCINVMKTAVSKYGYPEIINSDQGSQFTSAKWIDFFEGTSTRISMDGKGRALDNIYIERLWRTVKRDYVYLHPSLDGNELFKGLKNFFENYNYRKTHQGINRKTPASLYEMAS